MINRIHDMFSKKKVMKKILIIIVLTFLSTNLAAEWEKMGESDSNGGYTVYVDLETLVQIKDEAKMWTLIDFQVEQEETGARFLSKKVRRKYDCQGKHYRVLAYKLYSWGMGRGDLIRAYSQPQKWEEVQLGSMGEKEWKIACGQ